VAEISHYAALHSRGLLQPTGSEREETVGKVVKRSSASPSSRSTREIRNTWITYVFALPVKPRTEEYIRQETNVRVIIRIWYISTQAPPRYAFDEHTSKSLEQRRSLKSKLLMYGQRHGSFASLWLLLYLIRSLPSVASLE
jgi:hypothetical protein